MHPFRSSLLCLSLVGYSLSLVVPEHPVSAATVIGTTQTGQKVNITKSVPTAVDATPRPVNGIPRPSEHNGTHEIFTANYASGSNTPGSALNITVGIPSTNSTADSRAKLLESYRVRVNSNGPGHPDSLLAMKPAMTMNFADPAIVSDSDGYYWAFATDDVGKVTKNVMVHSGFNVQVANSSDFMQWNYHAADALPFAGKWTANPPGVWAPDVIQLDNGTFVLYYAAIPASDRGSHCIGAAHSAYASGPYVPLDAPLHCPTEEGGAIDPSGFRDPATGRFYVMFKIDGNNGQDGGVCGNINAKPRSTPIRIQEVDAADGASPIGNVVQILDRDNSDGALVEAPSMAAVKNVNATNGYAYVLFYSSHCYLTPDYNVRYAVSSNGVMNGVDNCANTTDHGNNVGTTAPIAKADYKKHPEPLLDTNATGLIGPGGLDVHPDGRHVVFHSAQVASNPGTRHMHWGMVNMAGDVITI